MALASSPQIRLLSWLRGKHSCRAWKRVINQKNGAKREVFSFKLQRAGPSTRRHETIRGHHTVLEEISNFTQWIPGQMRLEDLGQMLA